MLVKHIYDVEYKDPGFGALAISDFGLARVSDESLEGSGARVERPGGTLSYMAPEMFIDPDAVDYRVDIYAFGVMLFEMFTGHYPYRVKTAEQLVAAHIKDSPINPVRLNPALPPGLSALTLACLAKRPGHRPSDYNELYETLAAYLDDFVRPGAIESREEFFSACTQPLDEATEFDKLAQVLIATEEYQRAIEVLDRALELNPESATHWQGKAVAHARLYQWQEALEGIDRAISASRPETTKGFMAACLVMKGDALTRLGRGSDAISIFQLAAAMDEEIRATLIQEERLSRSD